MSDSAAVTSTNVLVLGIGNEFRRDDAVGLAVAKLLEAQHDPNIAVAEARGDAATIMDAWHGAESVIAVDAVLTGNVPGTVHRFDSSNGRLGDSLGTASTHGLGLREAIGLARALGSLPKSLIVYGIEALHVDMGVGLSAEVNEAASRAAEAIAKEIDARIGNRKGHRATRSS